jgi:hypothetical protein
MKQLTLQEHYNLIKEGKGHKDMFLKAAKSQFPNIVPNAATFEQTSTLLKQRSIISEAIWGVATGKTTQPDWFSIFNENVNENYVASSQEEPVKNSDKKISKEVEEDQESNFDYKDPKNRDNVYGQEFLTGYYTEMKDPKNSDKTVDELLELVSKNLAKDRLYYVKDGQFGVKGLGYTEDAPGLGAGKEAKGKYKSSGYGDLKERLGDSSKTYAVYKLAFGQPYNFYNEEKNKFIWGEPKEATLYTKEEAELKRRKLLQPYIDNYQKTGNNYDEIHVGDLYKKNILKENYEINKPKGPQNDAFNILLKKYSKDQIEKTWDENYDDIKQHYNNLNKANTGTTNVAQELANFIGDRINKNTSINEAPAVNNPKIEKIVAGINELISKAIDEDGDPIGVIDTTSTWEEPYVYSPIEYKNGALKITSKSVYGKDNEVDTIRKSDMEIDGIPTLRNIMKMYKRVLKKNNINEFQVNTYDFKGTGLIVVGSTKVDNNEISDMVDKTGYYAIWNAQEGYWFFPEAEETLDALEMELDKEFGKRGINARFESQVEESLNENNMIKLMDLFEGEYYEMPKKEKKVKEEPKKKVKKSAIADRVKEIEEESTFKAMEGKIQAMAEEIEMRENKLSMIDENEDLQEFINPVRIKEMQKEIADLIKEKTKMEKIYEKKSKGRKPKEVEVIDETETEEGY